VKLAVRLGGGAATATVCWDVTDCCGELLSITVRATVKEPAVEYAWVTEDPVPLDPSPKLQE
jgi:hypothetical protein